MRDELAVGWRAALAFGERRQDALGAGRRNDSPLRKRVLIDILPSVEPDRMRRAQAFELGRLLTAWGTVIAFLAFGGAWLADLDPALKAAALFVWVFSIIMWCVFGVVRHADALAELLGEPLGTLILTLSIQVIEVALIAAVMLFAEAAPTLGRDTMFALLMIVLNGVVGLALVLGGLRHHEQEYNLQGAVAYLAVIIPLSVIALVLPNFTRSTPDPSFTGGQAFFIASLTVLLYGVFLAIQTTRHRSFFAPPRATEATTEAVDATRQGYVVAVIARHTLLLVVTVLPIVLLSKQLAKLLDHGIDELNAPAPLGGVLIALIVFTPEGVSALRAAVANQLQRAVNLCLGAVSSTIGLTVPAVLGISLVTNQRVVFGLEPAEMTLLALTLIVSMLTFSGPRTTVLEGTVHLVLFVTYIVLIFSA